MPRYYKKKLYGEQSGEFTRKASLDYQAKHDTAVADEISKYGLSRHCDLEKERIENFIKNADKNFKQNRVL